MTNMSGKTITRKREKAHIYIYTDRYDNTIREVCQGQGNREEDKIHGLKYSER